MVSSPSATSSETAGIAVVADDPSHDIDCAARLTSRWDDNAAAACETELELRAYTSRLLGQDPALVLHGGGNTSVKLTETNIFGEAEDILWVKGSGWDLAAIEPAGFAPVRMRHLLALAKLERTFRHATWPRVPGRHDRPRRAGTVGRGDPPRDRAVQVRRPHARRRGAHAHELGERRRVDRARSTAIASCAFRT